MKNKHFYFLTALLAFAFFVFCASFVGCDSTKTLNWNKTASQQNFKIGDTISVEGIVYDPIGNPLKIEFDSDKNLLWVKKGWESKTNTSVYNPDEPDDADWNPNAPIGVVICTIYNPSSYNPLQRLDEPMHADR